MVNTTDAQESHKREATTSGPESAERPIPKEGLLLTHLVIVRDVDRSRRFYSEVLGAEVVFEGPPAILRWSNSWLVINTGGGPTDDKPDVVAVVPQDPIQRTKHPGRRCPRRLQALELPWREVPDAAHATPWGEIRCCLRDPDGHLIEVGQTTIPRQDSGLAP